MIRLQIDLGSLEEWPSSRLPCFTDQLLVLLPGLAEHGCSYRAPLGLVRRLRDGTWLGHVIEHVALELQKLAGASVTRGKTRSVKGRPGVYNVLYQYEDEDVGLAAGVHAIRLVAALLPSARPRGNPRRFEADTRFPRHRYRQGRYRPPGARPSNRFRSCHPSLDQRGQAARHIGDPAQRGLHGPARHG